MKTEQSSTKGWFLRLNFPSFSFHILCILKDDASQRCKIPFDKLVMS